MTGETNASRLEPASRQIFLALPPAQNYDPHPDTMRTELHGLLAEVQTANVLPWPQAKVKFYRTIFPQMINWLPEDEAKQLRFAFEAELERLMAV